jgi:predicted ATPase
MVKKSLHNFDVELNPLSVIFGPNAAGKSNSSMPAAYITNNRQ